MQHIARLESASYDNNDPRREACQFQYCDQLSSYECQAPNGSPVKLCNEHTTEFARVWTIELPRYRCSGDMPGAHVACDFTTNSTDEAFTHFETTTHNVDERCFAVDCDDLYHPTDLETLE